MVNDPLEKVFETPEQSLAHYLNAMPKSLVPVFQREFMRRPTPRTADGAMPYCTDEDGHDFGISGEFCIICKSPRR